MPVAGLEDVGAGAEEVRRDPRDSGHVGLDAGHHARRRERLAGEAGAQHVVGVDHHLHAHAAQVRVDDARPEVRRLAGLQGQPVQQQRHHDPDVPGVVRGDLGGRGVGPLDVQAQGEPAVAERDDLVHLVRRRGGQQQRLEHPDDAVEARAGSELVVHPLGHRVLQRPEDPQDLGGRPEADEGVEGGQRVDHLRLRVGVLEDPLRRLQRDALGLLGLVALARQLRVGVHLDRQRLGGREQLHHERQLAGDLAQRHPPLGALHHRGPQRVGAHPHLRHRLARGRLPDEGGDVEGRAPGVGLGRAVEEVHAPNPRRLPPRPDPLPPSQPGCRSDRGPPGDVIRAGRPPLRDA